MPCRVTLHAARDGVVHSCRAAARLRPVRRWLSILLLVLLPLQFAWAQAADYDVHGSGSHEMHFGHHDHGHDHDHDHGESPDASDGDAGASIDADGHHCHGQCSGMPAPVCIVAAVICSISPAVRIDAHSGALAPPRPERPQWRRLA